MEARTGHLSGAFVPAPDEYWAVDRVLLTR